MLHFRVVKYVQSTLQNRTHVDLDHLQASENIHSFSLQTEGYVACPVDLHFDDWIRIRMRDN